MSKGMTNQDIIYELDRIDGLYREYTDLNQEMDRIPSESKDEKDALAHEVLARLNEYQNKKTNDCKAKRPRVAAVCLTAPPVAPQKPKADNLQNDIKTGAISGLVMFGSILLWLFMVMINPVFGGISNTTIGYMISSLLNGTAVFMFFASIIYWFYKGKNKAMPILKYTAERAEWEAKQAEWASRFNESATHEVSEQFFDEFKKYDEQFLSLVDVCAKEYAKEIRRYEEADAVITQKYLNKLNEINDQLTSVIGELEKVSLIHNDLFPNARRIASMLRTGRADTLKEAINMALEEERIEREASERKAEALRQEAILEQQAEDNRRHNAAMARAAEEEARAARAHNAAMERAAKEQAEAAARQARATEKQNEMARDQARRADIAASRRCGHCANFNKCPLSVRMNATSCTSYRPR